MDSRENHFYPEGVLRGGHFGFPSNGLWGTNNTRQHTFAPSTSKPTGESENGIFCYNNCLYYVILGLQESYNNMLWQNLKNLRIFLVNCWTFIGALLTRTLRVTLSKKDTPSVCPVCKRGARAFIRGKSRKGQGLKKLFRTSKEYRRRSEPVGMPPNHRGAVFFGIIIILLCPLLRGMPTLIKGVLG